MTILPPPPALDHQAALFLDFDGTLIELAERPDAIHVPARLGPLLARLRETLGGRLAIVSGRALSELERYLPHSRIVFCGSHGLEFGTADGSRMPLSPPPGLSDLRERVRAFADDREGVLVEEKPAGVALHFRQAPAQASAVAEFMAGLAEKERLVVQPGNMVVELRPAGANKGDAIRRLMDEEPFRGATPFFIGDDLTDEDGFTVAAELGGAGVLVGVERATAARYRLASVQAVADWLERQA